MDNPPQSATWPPSKPTRTIPPYPGVRPGDSVGVHNAMRQQIAEGMGWRFQGLADWTTDDIVRTLHGLGIAVDVERFRDNARQYRTVLALADTWSVDIDETDLWVDFPLRAAPELWSRLAGDILA